MERPKNVENVLTIIQQVSGGELGPEPRSHDPESVLIGIEPGGLQQYATGCPKLELRKPFEEPYFNSPDALGIFLSENRAASALSKLPRNTNIGKIS